MRHIKNINIHCTAGFMNVTSIEKFWRRPKNQGGAGWKRSKGYNLIIDEYGLIWYLVSPSVYTGGYSLSPSKETLYFVTNGVLGHNHDSINISYIGGVDPTNYKVAKDTRTEDQKKAILEAINWTLCQLENHQPVDQIKIKGHRDFSDDSNRNGIIEPWERIKECPSFDAASEYSHIIREFTNK